jgi:hypothetical protein
MGRGVWVVGAVGIFAWLLVAACSIEGGDDDDGAGAGRPPGPTEECEAIYVPMYPAAEEAYRALRACLLCRACANHCASEVGDLCEPQPELDGCSMTATNCDECVASACALSQNPDTTFIGACAVEGNACRDTPDCVTLNNRVAMCVNAPPGTGGAGGTGGA